MARCAARRSIEHSKYYFEIGNVERLRQMYDLYKAEAEACIAAGLVLPAHDYVLKCSHTFNALDCRGAIGVTERQVFYGQMREMARRVAERYLEQRKELEYPLLKESGEQKAENSQSVQPDYSLISTPQSLLLEIGVEELPASDLDSAIAQLKVIRSQACWMKNCTWNMAASASPGPRAGWLCMWSRWPRASPTGRTWSRVRRPSAPSARMASRPRRRSALPRARA